MVHTTFHPPSMVQRNQISGDEVPLYTGITTWTSFRRFRGVDIDVNLLTLGTETLVLTVVLPYVGNPFVTYIKHTLLFLLSKTSGKIILYLR